MAKTEGHSEIPWKVADTGVDAIWIEDANGNIEGVCDLYNKDPNKTIHRKTNCKANAEFIVRAVNNHDKLVKALKVAIERLGFASYDIPRIHETIEQGLKAIKEAENA